jgi:hypothetical protein
MSLIKSKKRVADHGEVFTPPWMVESMLDLVRDESERIDARFLEPACGSGNFLVQVLKRKLATVERKYGKAEFERRHFALFGLMCLYGIELLPDNLIECRANLLVVFAEQMGLDASDELCRAAAAVLDHNIVQGDAVTLLDSEGNPIMFPEWGYLGAGRFNRRDFRFDKMIQSANYLTTDVRGTQPLFGEADRTEFFGTVREYPPFSISSLVDSLSKEQP